MSAELLGGVLIGIVGTVTWNRATAFIGRLLNKGGGPGSRRLLRGRRKKNDE